MSISLPDRSESFNRIQFLDGTMPSGNAGIFSMHFNATLDCSEQGATNELNELSTTVAAIADEFGVCIAQNVLVPETSKESQPVPRESFRFHVDGDPDTVIRLSTTLGRQLGLLVTSREAYTRGVLKGLETSAQHLEDLQRVHPAYAELLMQLPAKLRIALDGNSSLSERERERIIMTGLADVRYAIRDLGSSFVPIMRTIHACTETCHLPYPPRTVLAVSSKLMHARELPKDPKIELDDVDLGDVRATVRPAPRQE